MTLAGLFGIKLRLCSLAGFETIQNCLQTPRVILRLGSIPSLFALLHIKDGGHWLYWCPSDWHSVLTLMSSQKRLGAESRKSCSPPKPSFNCSISSGHTAVSFPPVQLSYDPPPPSALRGSHLRAVSALPPSLCVLLTHIWVNWRQLRRLPPSLCPT